jgi:hypothetical protein
MPRASSDRWCPSPRGEGAAQLVGHSRQGPVQRPQSRVGRQERRRKQLRIDVADPSPVQAMSIDERHDLFVRRNGRLRQVSQQTDYLPAVREVAESQFSGYPGMAENYRAFQQPHQGRIAVPKVFDPKRGIDEDQGAGMRRLGIGVSAASVPPSLASRRALSR